MLGVASLTFTLSVARDPGLTQEQVAQRMTTTQAVIARLEGGGSKPSTRTLERYAEATGSRLKITFEAERVRSRRTAATASRPHPSSRPVDGSGVPAACACT
jgi:transcriptional regulator with XRE-family HTH domain